MPHNLQARLFVGGFVIRTRLLVSNPSVAPFASAVARKRPQDCAKSPCWTSGRDRGIRWRRLVAGGTATQRITSPTSLTLYIPLKETNNCRGLAPLALVAIFDCI